MIILATTLLNYFAAAGDVCDPDTNRSSLFNFPTWYRYLDAVKDQQNICTVQFGALSDIWLIAAAVIEILLRLAAFAAVAMVIYSGVSYVTSQGEPEKTAKAKSTLVNAVIGLAIAVSASFIVSFIARSIT